MSEDLKKPTIPNSKRNSSENPKEDAFKIFNYFKDFLNNLFNFRDDTDHEATIQAIKSDIPFKGATAWILIFAVFVASIGLNANSTAVVIGAMLISPLMGPILGVGMSFALNDVVTLRKSVKNLGVMILLSLFASFMFFYLFPLSEDTSELLGRVSPDIRDVLIAFFGGTALMVARTKKGTVASVIFGVAIATALMPPLCTAGYGLAKGNFSYFIGAMYLFTINSIFIALATFLVLKLLKFPMHEYANAKKRKHYATMATLTGILVMIPAIITFVQVFNENNINNQINAFIKNEIKKNESLSLIDWDKDLKNKEISLNFFNEVTDATKTDLKNELTDNLLYPNLNDFKLKIKGSDTKSYELITTVYQENREELKESRRKITELENQILILQQTIFKLNTRIEQDAISKDKNAVAFSRIASDVKIRYIEVEEIGLAKMLFSKDFIKVDTIHKLTLKWNPKIQQEIIDKKELELRIWLQNQLKIDTLFVNREK